MHLKSHLFTLLTHLFFYASQLVIKNLSAHTFHGIIFIAPMSGQNRISPYNIKQTSDENKEKYHFRGLLVFIVVTTDFMIQVLKKYSNNIYHLLAHPRNIKIICSPPILQVAGFIYRFNLFQVQQWLKLPESLMSAVSRAFGGLFSTETPPTQPYAMGATLEIQRAQQVEHYEQQAMRARMGHLRNRVCIFNCSNPIFPQNVVTVIIWWINVSICAAVHLSLCLPKNSQLIPR